MSSIFGAPANPSSISTQSKPNLFGSLNTGAANAQPQQSSNIFGQPQQNQQQGGSLFGSTATSQPQQTGGLFGSSASQPQRGGGLFGATASSQPEQAGGLFGSTAQPQQGNGLFGASTQQQPQQTQQGGIFGALSQNNQQPQQQQGGGLFGISSNNNQQQQQGGSLFGGLNQKTQLQQQSQQEIGSLPQLQQQSRVWTEQDAAPRQKSVTDQIELVYSKWDPQTQNSLFQTYLYNTVSPDAAPFYRPDPRDDEEKWEEALRKKPNPGAIPFLVKGFEQLGHRIVSQEEHLRVLHGRLYEINNGLTDLLRRHDLEISTRATECKRRHLRISQKCLMLAAKVQVLRNRGYAMDGAEEDLRQKLAKLEEKVFDPRLNGRGEEIWARMVSVRERGRQLQFEFEKAGKGLKQDQSSGIDEEVMKRAKKASPLDVRSISGDGANKLQILEDYNSQLSHLTKELAQIQSEWEEWQQSKPPTNEYGHGR
ncbi:hypothetical protein MMC09_005647 [Bachmanniomyces sp. S44760]|nr:hypothetical protein [Bachmanniomyces sp. S44760]